jgi:hypothetical protein
MEVHHHPEVEKKGFKEYILEGLMIFIAVMMGFFAESIRENITNGEHAKKLTIQLVRDLQNDTTSLNNNLQYERIAAKRNDSLFDLLQQPLDKIDRVRLQHLVLKAYGLKLFYPTLGAITAIKNELHIKQFADSKIGGYITAYEDRAKVLKELEDIQKRNLSTYIEGFLKDHFTPENMKTSFVGEKRVANGDLRDLTQNSLTHFSIELSLIQGFNNDLISYDKKLKANAIDLLNYVKKQYDLEE